MSRVSLLLSFLFALGVSSSLAQYTPGQTYFGTNNYIEYHAGDLPIIISAPHGGYLTPVNIPDRNCSGCVTARDSRTEETAYQIDSAVQVLFGGHPHIIINKLARIKLDANREVVEAAQGNPDAETAWAEYHEFLQAAKDSSKLNFGSALYIDLHGHGHPIQRIEYGYLISRTQLQNSDANLDALNLQNSSSIKHLVNVLNPGASFAEILRGNECMGEYLIEHGFPGTPSATDSAPAPADPFFSGGYNTVRHGSRDSSAINGIQFELNWTGLRNTNANRKSFARGLACAMRDYLDRWFFDLDAWDPGNLVTSTADQGPGSLREALVGAEDGEVVSFAPSLNGDTIRLEKELRICREVRVEGPGADVLAISGGDSTRLIRILQTDSVVISGLSLTRGSAPLGEDGGGAQVEGTLSLINCKIIGNYADDDGGGLSIGENASVYLDSCTVANNSCGDDGGGLRNFNGRLVIRNSTVSNNFSPSYGGGLSSNGVLEIEACTFSGNEASSRGGAIRSFGGSLTAVNTTFEANIAGTQGGGISTNSDIDLNFCTLVNNSAINEGGGVRTSPANTVIENTLIAQNSAILGPDVRNNGGTVLSQGYNLVGDTSSSGWVAGIADQLGDSIAPIDPLVLPLANNGGPTATVGLSPASPCVDAGNAAGGPLNDQRGMLRTFNAQADIGAFEYHNPVSIPSENISQGFQLYPNPAHTTLTLEFPEIGNYEISAGNMVGQIIWQTQVSNAQKTGLDVSQWPKGAYWIRVSGMTHGEKIFMVR